MLLFGLMAEQRSPSLVSAVILEKTDGIATVRDRIAVRGLEIVLPALL